MLIKILYRLELFTVNYNNNNNNNNNNDNNINNNNNNNMHREIRAFSQHV